MWTLVVTGPGVSAEVRGTSLPVMWPDSAARRQYLSWSRSTVVCILRPTYSCTMFLIGDFFSCSSKTVKPKLRWRDIEYSRQ